MSNTRKRFDNQISVPVTAKVYEKLNNMADEQEVTVAHIVRVILEKVLFVEELLVGMFGKRN